MLPASNSFTCAGQARRQFFNRLAAVL